MAVARIVLLCIVAAMLYGVAQDMVTARVCVEYFTVGHPPVFDTESPTLLALGWGVSTTWWVGALLAVPLTVVSRAGGRPALDARDLVKPVLALLGVIAAVALAAGAAGWLTARSGGVWLLEPLASRVPREKHARFIADLWAHTAAYGAGFLGGIVLCALAWRRRGRTAAGIEGNGKA